MHAGLGKVKETVGTAVCEEVDMTTADDDSLLL